MSLATKYRPKDFDGVVGQTFVKETLKEAVKENKLVGAYLFCGPRGTGKTSVARILAKAINCLNPKDGNPCQKCEICKNFSEGKLIDIIEIDAASHTGVDNIRDIIEKAQFVPNKTKYKVYIIDEVHMLSTGAFNALLKILEEPPEFVKFILATTEIQKIPETILSRCQRYDFKNISDEDLKDRLEFIAKNEKIKVDKQALDFIVKNAHGGLRNAITMFEQFIIDNEILYQNIVVNLGITDTGYLKDFLNKLINKDKTIIEDFDKINESGKNIKLFFKDLIYLIRDEILEKIKKDEDIDELVKILDLLDETYTKTKNSMDEKITLFSGLLKVLTRNEKNEFNDFSLKKKELDIKKDVSKDLGGQEKKEISKKDKVKEEFESYQVCDLEVETVASIFGEDNLDDNKKEFEFSKDDLITKIKELGGKGGIIMGLKGGKVVFNGTELYIKTPTKIALTPFLETGSYELILEAMKELGFSDIKLKVE